MSPFLIYALTDLIVRIKLRYTKEFRTGLKGKKNSRLVSLQQSSSCIPDHLIRTSPLHREYLASKLSWNQVGRIHSVTVTRAITNYALGNLLKDVIKFLQPHFAINKWFRGTEILFRTLILLIIDGTILQQVLLIDKACVPNSLLMEGKKQISLISLSFVRSTFLR